MTRPGAGEAHAAAASATASLASLDVVVPAEDLALLDRLCAAAPSGSAAAVAELSRDGVWWSASCAGTTVRLRDTKGLRYLAELVGAPGSERHALDLVDRVEGVSADQPARRSLGDAGEVLGDVLRALGDLEPTTLAIMHGSSFQGDGRKALYQLAAAYEALAAS